jgi:hypothetical protein
MTVLKNAANVELDTISATYFAKTLEGKNTKDPSSTRRCDERGGALYKVSPCPVCLKSPPPPSCCTHHAKTPLPSPRLQLHLHDIQRPLPPRPTYDASCLYHYHLQDAEMPPGAPVCDLQGYLPPATHCTSNGAHLLRWHHYPFPIPLRHPSRSAETMPAVIPPSSFANTAIYVLKLTIIYLDELYSTICS